MEQPPKPTVVGHGPTGQRSREIRGGDTLRKVDVAAGVALTAESVFQWGLRHRDRSSVPLWFWQ